MVKMEQKNMRTAVFEENAEGFVYEWVNTVNGKWYIGSHKGSPTDKYIGSGISFKNAIKKHGISAFTRTIHFVGVGFRKVEDALLKERNATSDPMSYNMKNEALGATLIGPNNGMFNKRHDAKTKARIGHTVSTGERWGDDKKKDDHALKMLGEKNPMFGVSRKGTWAVEKSIITKRLKYEEWVHLKTWKHHRAPFLTSLKLLAAFGDISAPRGLKVIEMENFAYKLPPYVRFCNFEHRKLNVDYIRREFLWYLRGDRFDTSIINHANLWKSLLQPDGGINSNYGQYIFHPSSNQFQRMVDMLRDDKDTRRASIIILNASHVLEDTSDQPCTYALRFSIRNDKLGMTVHMRSQDAIFGMGNDAPCFSFIHEMLFCKLKEFYPDLEYGEYTHFADSFHVYEKHFELLKTLTGIDPLTEKTGNRRKIQQRDSSSHSMVLCPQISSGAEVDFLIGGQFGNIPEGFKFCKWLTNGL